MQVVLVYFQPFHRNLVLKCALQPKIAKKFTKIPLFGVRGRSRSSLLMKLKSPWPVLVMISNISVPICNRFHTRRTNSVKITSFKGDSPLWRPRSRGTPSPRSMKFHHDNLEFLRQPTVKIWWSQLAPFWYNTAVWRMDRRTDAQAIAKTCDSRMPSPSPWPLPARSVTT